MFVEGHPNI